MVCLEFFLIIYLLRNWDETAALDELFDHLRENQNTIRQNIVATAPPETSGNNLENPNISNIRELSGSSSTNPRNNFDHNRMRDLQSYFEGNFCNGPGSSLKNPNLSNIRENLTEGAPSSREQRNPKSIYDNLMEDWRRTGHVRRYNVPCSGMFFMDDGFGYDRMASRRLVPEMELWGNEFNNTTRETHTNGLECDISPVSEWEDPPLWALTQARMMFNSVNTDLAEADQSTEQMGPFLSRMSTIPDVDIGAMMQERCGEQHAVAEQLEEEVGHPLEADSHENLVCFGFEIVACLWSVGGLKLVMCPSVVLQFFQSLCGIICVGLLWGLFRVPFCHSFILDFFF